MYERVKNLKGLCHARGRHTFGVVFPILKERQVRIHCSGRVASGLFPQNEYWLLK